MTRYSQERKAAVLKKLLPPVSRSVADVAREEGEIDTEKGKGLEVGDGDGRR